MIFPEKTLTRDFVSIELLHSLPVVEPNFYTREGTLEPLSQAVRILYQEAMSVSRHDSVTPTLASKGDMLCEVAKLRTM